MIWAANLADRHTPSTQRPKLRAVCPTLECCSLGHVTDCVGGDVASSPLKTGRTETVALSINANSRHSFVTRLLAFSLAIPYRSLFFAQRSMMRIVAPDQIGDGRFPPVIVRIIIMYLLLTLTWLSAQGRTSSPFSCLRSGSCFAKQGTAL